MGPEALRVAGIVEAIMRLGFEVADRGNLTGPLNPLQSPSGGFRHLAEVVAWNRLVHDAVHAELAAGCFPVLLGGDHSLAIGSVAAVARHCRARGRTLRLLWLDAHAAFNTAQLTPSGNIHGMPLACLCGFGPPELTRLADAVPALDPADVRELGIRSVDEAEKRFLH